MLVLTIVLNILSIIFILALGLFSIYTLVYGIKLSYESIMFLKKGIKNKYIDWSTIIFESFMSVFFLGAGSLLLLVFIAIILQICGIA